MSTLASPRLRDLDAVRAIAIVSMTFGHVADYSFLWRISHPFMTLWDGASLFVLVSGVVVGVVYRRGIELRGMAWSAGKLAKRAGFLYLTQLVLVALALTIGYTHTSRGADQFMLPGVDTLPAALGWALVLGANPIYVNFLSLYVVLLLAIIPALYLLSTGRCALLLAVLVVVYVAGITWPRLFTLPDGPDISVGFNLATWFVLFATGVWAGWIWRERKIDQHLRSPWYFGLLGVLLFALATFAMVTTFSEPQTLEWWWDKDSMAPLRFLAAWIFFIGCYWLIHLINRIPSGEMVTNQMAVLGSRSLDAVVTLTLVAILTQGVFDVDSASRLAQALALATIVVAWAWARMRTSAEATSSRSR